MRLLNLLFKTLFGILCATGIIGFIEAGIHTYTIQQPNHLIQLAVGAGAFSLIWFLFLSRKESFWSVVEHELTHAVFALMFFKKVRTINADRRKGGLVKVEGGNFIIALAPYFFPLLSVIIIVVKPLMFSTYQWLLNGLLGFTLMFHLLYLLNEFHPSQPDLQQTGFLFSTVVVLFLNLFFIGLSLASLQGTWSNMEDFIRMGARESYNFIVYGWSILNNKFFIK